MRGCHSPGSGRITAPGSSSPAIDAHRAAEAAADLERGLDDGVAGEAWWDRLKIRDSLGRCAAGRNSSALYGGPAGRAYCADRLEKFPLVQTGRPAAVALSAAAWPQTAAF
jgi:hypothetical protein